MAKKLADPIKDSLSSEFGSPPDITRPHGAPAAGQEGARAVHEYRNHAAGMDQETDGDMKFVDYEKCIPVVEQGDKSQG